MKSSVRVPATKTWDLIRSYDIYSCPDPRDYDFTKHAQSLLIHSKRGNKTMPRVVDAEISLTADRPDITLVPLGLCVRLCAYIARAASKPGILNNKCERHRFYFLRPAWIQSPENLETDAVLALWQEKDCWFRWPKESMLLRRDWTRDRDGSRTDCYFYDKELTRRLKEKNLKPDGRNNGPAILSFLMAGGERPVSVNEGWPIHHIYDGELDIPGSQRKKIFSHT